MEYIRKNTNGPVPQVYHFDTTEYNEIYASYIAMCYVSGRTFSCPWFDTSGPKPLEGRRRKILSLLADAMSQLQKLHFNSIGLLPPAFKTAEMVLSRATTGTRREMGRSVTPPLVSSQRQSFLKKSWALIIEKIEYAIGTTKFLEEMLPHLPHTSKYVLALPDFDSQNFMADGEGNITGLMDWDNL